MSDRYAFVMMIKEKYWNGFQEFQSKGRQVHSYVHANGRAPPKNTKLIFFYVTRPASEIAAYAEFIERKVGNAEEVWKEHGSESVLSSKELYDGFVGGTQKVSFTRFKNLRETAKPIPLKNLLTFLGIKRLSRRGFYISKETADKLIALMN